MVEISIRTVKIGAVHYFVQSDLHLLCHLTCTQETGSETVYNLSKVTQQARL